MAAPPGREIRAGAASWPGAFGIRVSRSPGLKMGSLPVGESRCLASHLCPPNPHTGACGEIEAGGEGVYSRWRGASG